MRMRVSTNHGGWLILDESGTANDATEARILANPSRERVYRRSRLTITGS
jgi:hypothetical protein